MKISNNETILSRQLNMICNAGISEIIILLRSYNNVILRYCNSLNLPIKISFVNYLDINCNFIKYEQLDCDILIVQSDLIFEYAVFDAVVNNKESCMVVSSTLPLADNDTVVTIQNGLITKLGNNFLTKAVTAYPMYKILKKDCKAWFDNLTDLYKNESTDYQVEKVFTNCQIHPLDIKNQFCRKINNIENLVIASYKLKQTENRIVYMCFSTDIVHNGHISIIKRAMRLGKPIIGLLSDKAMINNGQTPLVSFYDRKSLFENIGGVYKVIEQKTISFKENIEKYKPSYVLFDSSWNNASQKPICNEVLSIIAKYGGQIIFYSLDEKYKKLEQNICSNLSLPDVRRVRLRKAISTKGLINAIEAHDGLTGLIAENTLIYENCKLRQFDAMWISSLCDSTIKGKPDIEIVDLTSRFRTIDEIMDVTTKPIIFDGETGGLTEHFVYTVKTLERMGVSMVIIEDKSGFKRNSLFGADVQQTQASISEFCRKIEFGKKAQSTGDFMICARIESLILERGMDDALKRAFAYVDAGADSIMIHSRQNKPCEIFEFVDRFRFKNNITPIVVVPTSFSEVTEEEFEARGVNVVIYANQLTRASFPAMQNVAKMILKYHRAKECDDVCMPFKDIIKLIENEI